MKTGPNFYQNDKFTLIKFYRLTSTNILCYYLEFGLSCLLQYMLPTHTHTQANQKFDIRTQTLFILQHSEELRGAILEETLRALVLLLLEEK